jgi:apolipoprotein N-acyltransferase
MREWAMVQVVQQDFRAVRARRAVASGPAIRAQGERFLSRTLVLSVAGALLLWGAFPPLNWAWLAWFAPVPWLWLAGEPRLPGRWPYLALWLGGLVHWLLMLDGIRLAHPALYAGWVALAAYLAVYLPLFVGLCRTATQQLRWPLIAAAPLLWIGLELLRGHLITGFSMGLLAHTQAEFPRLLQICDLAGGYTLSLVIMLVAACLTGTFAAWSRGRRNGLHGTGPWIARLPWQPLIPAVLALAATLAYGQWRLSQTPPGAGGPAVRVALIQGSLDTVFDAPPGRRAETYEHYRLLTAQATSERPDLDLVVWPESMFMDSEVLIEEPLRAPPGSSVRVEETRAQIAAHQAGFAAVLANEAALTNRHADTDGPGTQLLVGTTSYVVFGAGEQRTYNTALLADRTGNVVGRYHKTHPVMFGEYIPFAAAFPWLYRLTPMTSGLSSGDGPRIFAVGGLKLSPSICFESTVPHLIRSHLADLDRRGTPADLLVNVTNDGWFWGTSMLDLHFRCGVLRAVENRTPLIVAANTGISAWVDGNGVVRARGPRRQPRVLLAEARGDGRRSAYRQWGDLAGWLGVGLVVFVSIWGCRTRLQSPPNAISGGQR